VGSAVDLFQRRGCCCFGIFLLLFDIIFSIDNKQPKGMCTASNLALSILFFWGFDCALLLLLLQTTFRICWSRF
jgi:hypothetical protein